MEIGSKQRNIDEVDALMDAQDERKVRLDDRESVFESVAYLASHGYGVDEIYRCLVRYFYVDLDILGEAVAVH